MNTQKQTEPAGMSETEVWRSRVKAHHAQSINAMGSAALPDDFWESTAHHFRSDPHRTDDPALDRLLQMVSPGDTMLDVGGGGGRYALPLALKCRHVTVVEPSPSMVEVLKEGASEHGIRNLSVANAPWEDAAVESADLALSAHVLYGIEEVGPFILKMVARARRLVCILLHMESPQSHLAGAWRLVHGEERITLPGMRELVPVLWEMGIYPNLGMLEAASPRTYDSRESALIELKRRLYVRPGTEQEERLLRNLDAILVQTPSGFAVRGAPPRRLALAWWETSLTSSEASGMVLTLH